MFNSNLNRNHEFWKLVSVFVSRDGTAKSVIKAKLYSDAQAPWRISITLLSHRVLFIVPRERAETALWWMLIQLVGWASRAEQRRMRMHINNRWLWAISCEWADWYTADCRIQQLMSEWDSINNVCPSTPCNYCIHYFIRRVYRNCNKLLAVARNSFRANYAFFIGSGCIFNQSPSEVTQL